LIENCGLVLNLYTETLLDGDQVFSNTKYVTHGKLFSIFLHFLWGSVTKLVCRMLNVITSTHTHTHGHTHTHTHYPVLSDDVPFPGLKENFRGHRFNDDDGVEMNVM